MCGLLKQKQNTGSTTEPQACGERIKTLIRLSSTLYFHPAFLLCVFLLWSRTATSYGRLCRFKDRTAPRHHACTQNRLRPWKGPVNGPSKICLSHIITCAHYYQRHPIFKVYLYTSLACLGAVFWVGWQIVGHCIINSRVWSPCKLPLCFLLSFLEILTYVKVLAEWENHSNISL